MIKKSILLSLAVLLSQLNAFDLGLKELDIKQFSVIVGGYSTDVSSELSIGVDARGYRHIDELFSVGLGASLGLSDNKITVSKDGVIVLGDIFATSRLYFSKEISAEADVGYAQGLADGEDYSGVSFGVGANYTACCDSGLSFGVGWKRINSGMNLDTYSLKVGYEFE